MFLVSAFQAEPVKSMLMSFGPVQQFFFWMAVGHWITALWEDWRTRSFLHQGLTSNSAGGLAFFPLNLCCSSAQVMYCMYTAHHVVTVFAYLYTLATYQLGGVMVQGLIFELPVMFMLRRELGNAQHELPGWLQHERSTSRHWRLTYLMFFAGRGIAEVLWVMSMLPGHSGTLQDCLSDASLVVYHTLAVFFTSLNVRILGLLMCWHQQDVSRARYNVETNLWQEIRAGGRGEEHGLAEAVVWNGAVWFFGGYTKKDFSKCGTSIVLPPCAGLRLGQFLARADTWRGPRAMSETQEALEEWASFGSCAAVMACARTVRWQRALQLLSWSRHGIRARADIPCGIQQFLLAHGLHNGSAQC
ncbi:unnamed protein product [Effrenium voratum]|nr:unnamed protein product [Effrenium voratum]